MYRVRTVFRGVAGTPWYSNLFFDDQDPGGAQGAIDAVAAFWGALAPVIAGAITWRVEPEVFAISPGTGEIENVFTETAATGAGNASGEALPYANQGLIRTDTGAYVGGRRLRGRIFIPGPTETFSQNGVPSASYLELLNDAPDVLIGSETATWVLYSRKNFIQSPIVGATAAGYWAVLRSRRD